MVTTISNNQIRPTLVAYQSSTVEISKVSTSSGQGGQTVSSDTVSLHRESTQALTYSNDTQLNASDGARFGMLQNLVANLLKEQGINTKISMGGAEVDLATITPEKATELVSEDGYFGVKQTSDRIFQFAVGAAGGDPSRINAIKEGIEKGFAEAKKAFGDWLPDISYQTHDAVMKKLDDWVAQSKAEA